jgi:hypothetical protein
MIEAVLIEQNNAPQGVAVLVAVHVAWFCTCAHMGLLDATA